MSFFKENQRLIILRHDVLHKLHRQNGPYDDYDAGTYIYLWVYDYLCSFLVFIKVFIVISCLEVQFNTTTMQFIKTTTKIRP